MTEESKTEKKSKSPRRAADVIASEKRAWLAKHEWKGVADALEHIHDAQVSLTESKKRAGERASSAPFDAARTALSELDAHLAKILPPEAR